MKKSYLFIVTVVILLTLSVTSSCMANPSIIPSSGTDDETISDTFLSILGIEDDAEKTAKLAEYAEKTGLCNPDAKPVDADDVDSSKIGKITSVAGMVEILGLPHEFDYCIETNLNVCKRIWNVSDGSSLIVDAPYLSDEIRMISKKHSEGNCVVIYEMEYPDAQQFGFSEDTSSEADDVSGNNITFVFDGTYSEDFPLINSDVLYELKAETIESEVFEQIGCSGKIIGSGRLIVGYELEEGGKARLFFDPLGSRDVESFDRFKLTKVEILTDDWDLVKTVLG
ncbi:MAG: hypothetical protein IJU75_02835 [Clostridia bacterium]|nr:hypothetical protein [Clostridia bacterium]